MTLQVRYYQDGDVVGDMYRPGDQLCSLNDIIVRHGTFARTVTYEGTIVAAFGCVMRYPGVADAWAVVSDDARGHGLSLTRLVRRQMHDWIKQLYVWRVTAGVVDGERSLEYARWAELLGFEFESVEACAGPHGEDIWRYRWIAAADQ